MHQPPWSFGFDSQTRGTRENSGTLMMMMMLVKVPGSSRVPGNSFVLGPAVINAHTQQSLVANVFQYPPHTNSFVLGPAVINTHKNIPSVSHAHISSA